MAIWLCGYVAKWLHWGNRHKVTGEPPAQPALTDLSSELLEPQGKPGWGKTQDEHTGIPCFKHVQIFRFSSLQKQWYFSGILNSISANRKGPMSRNGQNLEGSQIVKNNIGIHPQALTSHLKAIIHLSLIHI